MTCVVGIVQNNRICLGADSASVGGWSLQLRKDPKVFRVGDMLIGFTTSWRMGQILQYQLELPEHNADADAHEWMVSKFVEAVRKCLKAGGFSEINDNVETGGFFLVGFSGKLFTVEANFQVGERLQNYAAVGCGADLALGSLYATGRMKSIRRRVEIALEAAEEFSAGVARPFNFIEIKYKSDGN